MPFRSPLVLGVIAAGAMLLFSGAAVAQDAPIFSVNVKVVNVLAIVRDKQGNLVSTLGKDDFLLREDGRPQSIRYFTRETDVPLTLGLVVDVSGSQVQAIEEEKSASAAFAKDVLRADTDSSFLIQFAGEAELLEDVTKDPTKVQASLQDLETPTEDDNTVVLPGDGRPGHGTRGGGTLLYDAIFLASNEIMQKQQGRKAIVVLTDGVDHGSKMSLDRAIESAQRANTMVYSIYFEGDGSGDDYGDTPQLQQRDSEHGKEVLERLSKETGGRMFVVSNQNSVTQIYAQIQDELRNEYNIGYSPDRAPTDKADYRHITLAVKQKDYKVQAREGYYASRQIDSGQTQSAPEMQH